MNINIIGRHLEITPALKQHIENKFIKIKNHFKDVLDVKFILSVEKVHSLVDATIRLPHLDINAKSIDEDMYKSMSEAEIVTYLSKEEVKIEAVHQQMLKSIGEAKN